MSEPDSLARRVGTVQAVSASTIRASLDVEAPHGVALGSGTPIRFPRVNGIVVLPTEDGQVVGIVHSLAIVPSNFPKRTGLRDYGVVDLPFPARQVEITPLGVLRLSGFDAAGRRQLSIDRGVLTSPTVGAPILMPSEEELSAVIEGSTAGPRVAIGHAALARHLPVRVDPDRLFGRHVAVLGNTGSGKSCTVAGLVRWSIEAAAAENPTPNARFVILDPNGEYRSVFNDLGQVRVFRAEPDEESGDRQLRVPAWLWNATEWAAFSEASRGVQRPLLHQALRNLRSAQTIPDEDPRRLAVLVRGYLGMLQADIARGPAAYTNFPTIKNLGERLQAMRDGFKVYEDRAPAGTLADAIGAATTALAQLVQARINNGYWSNFSEPELQQICTVLEALDAELPAADLDVDTSEDAPIAFDVSDIAGHVEVLASGEFQASQFVGSFGLRIRTMLSHLRMRSVVGTDEAAAQTIEEWLDDYLSMPDDGGPSIVVVDLSLVPSELMHVVSAVISRVIFEALQRYRRQQGTELPTVLVVEEAHHFVHRYAERDQGASDASMLCRHTIETIAREGRKFGLGLVLSSQRPSEVSPTVLSQCNTFVLHRIVNDRDQELVRRLVPDNLGNMLDDLPSLPTRHAILLGWASAVPLLVEVRELQPAQRPFSNDPNFWSFWTDEESVDVDWAPIAADWRGEAT